MKKMISGTMDLIKEGDHEPYVRACKYTVIVSENFDDLDTELFRELMIT